jgi:glycosyltransferase involved in cell wall biosynthesis
MTGIPTTGIPTTGAPISIVPISVAMATYNGAAFLRPQLDSLAAQTHLPSELVITDDGSTDDTRAIVENFAATAPFPVHFHPNPHRLGFRGNFIRAAGLCTGELIAYSDQDDIWHPTKLAATAALFDQNPDVLLVHHNANILAADGTRVGLLAPAGRHPESYGPLTAPPWLVSHGFTQTFRRELLAFQDLWENSLDASVADERMTHDQWYLFFASIFGRILWIDTPLAEYRQHRGNTQGWFHETMGRRLQLWLEDRSGVYARCAAAAARRAEILDVVLARVDNPDWRTRVTMAITRYRTLAALYQSRVQVYRARGLASRLGAFRALLASNAYNRKGDWTFNAQKGACKDFALGVFAGPVLHRYGYSPDWGDPTCSAGANG